MARRLLIDFEGLDAPIAFVNARRIVKLLPAIFCYWPFRVRKAKAGAEAAVLSVHDNGEGYLIEAPWLDEACFREHEVDAICALIIEVNWAYLRGRPELLCIHGAAAEFSGRLVVFPNRYRAGKSVLSACLAAAGQRLFTDDILTVDPEAGDGEIYGVATGIAPRLRLPVPQDLGPALTRFLEERKGPQSELYRYLRLGTRELAPRGTRAPIGGFVLLERGQGQTPAIEPVSEADMLRQVVWQNFARHKDSSRILADLRTLIARSARYRMRYETADQAVALLQQTFGDWDAVGRGMARDAGEAGEATATLLANPQQTESRDQRTSYRPADPASEHLQQAPGVKEHEVDGEKFLADAAGAAIHNLNPTGAIIWQMLREPTTEREVVALLSELFPDVPAEQISNDVAGLLKGLEQQRLIRRVTPLPLESTEAR